MAAIGWQRETFEMAKVGYGRRYPRPQCQGGVYEECRIRKLPSGVLGEARVERL